MASAVGGHYKLPGNPTPNIKQRGISISKSNREHKLNVERSSQNNLNNVSGIYQTEMSAGQEDTKRTVTSANNIGMN